MPKKFTKVVSSTEENYLKAIFSLQEKGSGPITTNNIAAAMNTAAATVTDMLKRLSEKKLINYQPYKGVSLTAGGKKLATRLIRKHRLWETFLVKKLSFTWDEVHDIAEELEHIDSKLLIQRLDEFLGYPKYDPHGDPIPDENGRFEYRSETMLSELQEGQIGTIVGVAEHSTSFLKYLNSLELVLGKEITVKSVADYDNSMIVLQETGAEVPISHQVSKNLYVKQVKK